MYRLATALYKDDLSGNGARIFGGRWNARDVPVLYTTENISLALLEILVRADKYTIPDTYHLLRIKIPDTEPVIISKEKLPAAWKDDIMYTQWLGNEFVRASQALALKVPSAVVDEEHNFVLNTGHKDFSKVKITAASPFLFDRRLFLSDE
ncbi:MAG TPA: RES family NAD+ phosphorylase [Ferruginibacter sp.]|nr:RES family NAD+ phosphorylase [Ferruginibacter sp.]HMP20870.1 RES family NAD+ phosphorylase [Ferruginibacter sp.]